MNDSVHGRRKAVTLIEVLVVISVMGILIGLLLVAVQTVRSAAERQTAINSMRQVVLATHNYAGNHDGLVPNCLGVPPTLGRSALVSLAPFLEVNVKEDEPGPTPSFLRFRADPSRNAPATDLPVLPTTVLPPPGLPPPVVQSHQLTVSSIAFNALAFAPNMRYSTSFPDGHSTTIGLSEHYGVCGPTSFVWTLTQSTCLDGSTGQPMPCRAAETHRTTFADSGYDDVQPVSTKANGGTTTLGTQRLTFQVRPSTSTCDPRVPQSSFSSGLLIGFMDGSVRSLKGDVSESIFWGAVTPASSETIAID